LKSSADESVTVMVKLLAADGACDISINLIRSLRLVNHSVDDPVQTLDPLSQLCTWQHQATYQSLRETQRQLIVNEILTYNSHEINY